MKNLGLTRRHTGKPGAVERAERALECRGKSPLTMLEAEVLALVSLDCDPYRGWGDTTRSRTTSQAKQRLRGKGFLVGDARTGEHVTSAGHDALAATWRWALYNRQHP